MRLERAPPDSRAAPTLRAWLPTSPCCLLARPQRAPCRARRFQCRVVDTQPKHPAPHLVASPWRGARGAGVPRNARHADRRRTAAPGAGCPKSWPNCGHAAAPKHCRRAPSSDLDDEDRRDPGKSQVDALRWFNPCLSGWHPTTLPTVAAVSPGRSDEPSAHRTELRMLALRRESRCRAPRRTPSSSGRSAG